MSEWSTRRRAVLASSATVIMTTSTFKSSRNHGGRCLISGNVDCITVEFYSKVEEAKSVVSWFLALWCAIFNACRRTCQSTQVCISKTFYSLFLSARQPVLS